MKRIIGTILFVEFILLIGVGLSKAEHTPDYADTVKKKTFVDKTLLIMELLSSGRMVSVTAPRKYGKSTNMRMVKQFLELETDGDGRPPRYRNATKNYKLFTENGLNIHKHKAFFDKNFGKHPVLFVDFKPLELVDNYGALLVQLARVVQDVYVEHMRIMHFKRLYTLSKESSYVATFNKYLNLDEEAQQDKNESVIIKGFKRITEIMYRLYGDKKLYVLIDNANICLPNLLFNRKVADDSEIRRIVDFLLEVQAVVLNGKRYMHRAFVTGTHHLHGPRRSDNSLDGAGADDLIHYSALNTDFYKFYYATHDDLKILVSKYVDKIRIIQRKKLARRIERYYGGYHFVAKRKQVKIYNMYAIVKFFKHRYKVKNYWCRKQKRATLKSVLSVAGVGADVKTLLTGGFGSALGDNFSEYTGHKITTIRRYTSNATRFQIDQHTYTNPFADFLYSTGYVTTTKSVKPGILYNKYHHLRVPNRAVALHLADVLKETYVERYNLKTDYVRVFGAILGSLRRFPGDRYKIERLQEVLRDLVNGTAFMPKTVNNLDNLLVSLVASKTTLEQAAFQRWESHPCMTMVNRNGVAVLMVLYQNVEGNACRGVMNRAKVLKSYARYLDEDLEDKRIIGRVYIEVCCAKAMQRVDVGFSFFFREVDDISNVTYV